MDYSKNDYSLFAISSAKLDDYENLGHGGSFSVPSRCLNSSHDSINTFYATIFAGEKKSATSSSDSLYTGILKSEYLADDLVFYAGRPSYMPDKAASYTISNVCIAGLDIDEYLDINVSVAQTTNHILSITKVQVPQKRVTTGYLRNEYQPDVIFSLSKYSEMFEIDPI